MFCMLCAPRDKCGLCRKERPHYNDVPVYVTDKLREVIHVSCKLCHTIVVASDAHKHYFQDCKRLVRTYPTPGLQLSEQEACIGVVNHGTFSVVSTTWITTTGSIYTGSDTSEPAMLDEGQTDVLAPGLQWILQQLVTTIPWSGRLPHLQSMVSVLREAERYKRNDFGLPHERELQTKVNELTERVKRLENQRSTLRTEISELEHNYNITVDQLEASEERCAGLLIDLTETQGMLQDMQNFHLNQTAPTPLVDCVPSTRKRRRTPTTVSSGAVFDGQPPDPHSSSSSPTTSQ